MADLEALYARLPVPLQNLGCSLEGWRIQRRRFGPGFRTALADVAARGAWPEERILAFRDERLRAFVRHCAETVPYYARVFRDIGITSDDIRTARDFSALPILTKDEVKAHIADFASSAVEASARVPMHTSGTTGGGLVFSTTEDAVHEQWAVWWRYRARHGLEPGVWCGYFGGRSVVPVGQSRPPFWRYNRPGRQVLFSGYHMNAANLDGYVEELRRRRPTWLHGYPSLLSLLAAHVVETGHDLGYEVRFVTTGAENLLDHQADLIERAFGTRPIQHYGMAEAVANASQCPAGRMHVDEDFAFVEFVESTEAEGLRVVGTNFTNLATPLLRYDVGDVVTLSNESCACGMSGRVLESIDGRREDFVVLADGSRVGRMDHVFKDLVNVREAQIVQRIRGEIVVRIVQGDRYTTDDEALLLGEMRKRVGQQTIVRVEYHDRLERSKAGKLRLVVSEIGEGRLESPALRSRT